mmetsp:Transcript_23739/g.35400  ORF Transcript_23739/g.35400 Transcript_23739/m.35400 type:complete len:170 (+) Transcript_23739:407-916(+)
MNVMMRLFCISVHPATVSCMIHLRILVTQVIALTIHTSVKNVKRFTASHVQKMTIIWGRVAKIVAIGTVVHAQVQLELKCVASVIKERIVATIVLMVFYKSVKGNAINHSVMTASVVLNVETKHVYAENVNIIVNAVIVKSTIGHVAIDDEIKIFHIFFKFELWEHPFI